MPKNGTVFIVALQSLEIEGRLGNGITYRDVTLANDWRTLKRILSPEFFDFIGRLEEQAILTAPAFIYSEIETAVQSEDHKETLMDYLFRARMLLMGLWFVKDNAVDYELGFLATPKEDGLLVSSNFISTRFSMHDGEESSVRFSSNELTDAAQFMSQNFNPPADFETGVLTDSTRIERAFYFLQVARSAYEVPLKVSYYCTAFECLFATSTAELTHKLAERVASIISQTAADRLVVYKRVKRAYQIRSKVVHGDRLSTKDLHLANQAAEFCDHASRRIMTNLLSSEPLRDLYRGKNEILEDFLMLLTFGATLDEALAMKL